MNNFPGSKDSERPIKKRLFPIHQFKVDIIFMFCLIMVPTVAAVTFYTYWKNRQAAMEMTDQLAYEISCAVMEKTAAFLKPAQGLSKITARLLQNPQGDIGPGSDLETYFIEVVREFAQIDLIYYGNEAGEFSAAVWMREDQPIVAEFILCNAAVPFMVYNYYNADGTFLRSEETRKILLDPRIRPWYRDAREKMTTVWTDIYIFASSGKPGITASTPVLDKTGRFLGVAAADITLDELSRFLQRLKISEHGLVFIMDEKKQLVAFPEEDRAVQVKDGKIVPVRAVELNQAWITVAVRRFEDTGEQRFTFESDGRRNLAYFSPFPSTFGKAWTIVALAPEDDFLGPIQRTHRMTLLMSAVFLLIAVGCGLLFARTLSRPLEQLTREVGKIRQFDLSGKVAISTYINEILILSNAVRSMKNGLQAFRRYVPATLVRQLIESGEEVRPGGKERELTLFFADIEGFTAISEQIPPKELMINLSAYLDVMHRVISAEQGTVDKFIGDGVMAFWGAPLSNEAHAVCACRAALQCRRALAELNEQWAAEGKIPFHTRIGLHTGFTIVGNMGTEERLNYTVLGDTVNLASRLEGVNKFYGTRIIVSQATHRFIRNAFIVRPLDVIAVKGRISSVMIYELMGGKKDPEVAEMQSLADDFSAMFALYLDRQWDPALEILARLAQRYPEDKPVHIYLERCRAYREKDPGGEWTGAFRFDVK